MSRRNALSVAGWRPLFVQAQTHADQVAPGLAERTRQELHDVLRCLATRLPTRIIHADLFTDNVFFIGSEVMGLIDFYFRVLEVPTPTIWRSASTPGASSRTGRSATPGTAMIAGYQSVRRLAAEEVDALPILCQGSALRFMLTRLVDWLNVPRALW